MIFAFLTAILLGRLFQARPGRHPSAQRRRQHQSLLAPRLSDHLPRIQRLRVVSPSRNSIEWPWPSPIASYKPPIVCRTLLLTDSMRRIAGWTG